ncbi:hypothetical protein AB0Q95_43565 [Streptomyces sp. NPDC059900]|uniref:hypothetical protein n=1 Tax=Streptomyces sp. NPDC059900 TaxID=3155816 RepID=UPI003443D69A
MTLTPLWKSPAQAEDGRALASRCNQAMTCVSKAPMHKSLDEALTTLPATG